MEKQSLVSLTQGFMRIISEAENTEVDLATIESTLQTTKRRLYDVINVLAGVGIGQRTGKSRVRLVSARPADTSASAEQLEHERELDRLIGVVDAELADLSNSELFKRCAWLDRQDVEACEPDSGVALFALHGPSSMSIEDHDDENDAENRTIICKVESPQDEPIQLEPIRPG
jgi:hypothetical protein